MPVRDTRRMICGTLGSGLRRERAGSRSAGAVLGREHVQPRLPRRDLRGGAATDAQRATARRSTRASPPVATPTARSRRRTSMPATPPCSRPASTWTQRSRGKGKRRSGLVSLEATVASPVPAQFPLRDVDGNRFLIPGSAVSLDSRDVRIGARLTIASPRGTTRRPPGRHRVPRRRRTARSGSPLLR